VNANVNRPHGRFGEAAQLVPRREREQIQPLIGRGAHRAREQERLGANVGIDEAQPFALCRNGSSADPTRVRLSGCAARERGTAQQRQLRIVLGERLHEPRRLIGRLVVDHDEVEARDRIALAEQRLQAAGDIGAFVTDGHDDRHVWRVLGQKNGTWVEPRKEAALIHCAADQPANRGQPRAGQKELDFGSRVHERDII